MSGRSSSRPKRPPKSADDYESYWDEDQAAREELDEDMTQSKKAKNGKPPLKPWNKKVDTPEFAADCKRLFPAIFDGSALPRQAPLTLVNLWRQKGFTNKQIKGKLQSIGGKGFGQRVSTSGAMVEKPGTLDRTHQW